VYVETDFLVSLLKEEDWLAESATETMAERDVHTSVLAYAEVLVLFYDRERASYAIDAPRAIANLLEMVPVVPEDHADAVLAAAAFLEEFDMTPFDALHAGIVTTGDGRVCSSDRVYDDVGLERVPLEPEE
jgi:predicted nucleic acid-binding protein